MSQKSRETVKADIQSWQTPNYESINNDKNYNEHFTPLFDSLIESDAWKNLSPVSQSLYILLMNCYRGNYTGNTVICTYEYCEKHGFRRQNLKKHFKELFEAGFIRIEPTDGRKKTANRYTLIDWWWKKGLSHRE